VERKPYWYSVIQYQPDKLKGERINVGLLVHDPAQGKVIYKILTEENFKVRSFISNATCQRLYRTHREFSEYLMLHLNDNSLNMVGNIQVPNPTRETFLKELSDVFPETLFLSEPTFITTENVDRIFNVILVKYLGEQFTRAEDRPLSTKVYMKQYFEERHWIGTKVKSNIKLRPLKEVPNMKFKIDFIFKNGVWNLIQALPATDDRLPEWFSKTHLMLESYQEKSDIYILMNKGHLPQSTTAHQMLKYLKKDERVREIKIETPEFRQLTSKIESEAKDISDLGDELAVS